LGGFDVIFAVFLLESLYSAGCIDIFLLAGIERMAHRANFGVDFFDGTAGLEGVAAAAMNHYLIVFWMYSFFHNLQFSRYLQSRILTVLAAYCNINFNKFYFFSSGTDITFLLDDAGFVVFCFSKLRASGRKNAVFFNKQ
jgi:hypothetical protein